MDVGLSEFWELVMDREAWRAAIHGVAKSWTQLSDSTELNWTDLFSNFPPEGVPNTVLQLEKTAVLSCSQILKL